LTTAATATQPFVESGNRGGETAPLRGGLCFVVLLMGMKTEPAPHYGVLWPVLVTRDLAIRLRGVSSFLDIATCTAHGWAAPTSGTAIVRD